MNNEIRNNKKTYKKQKITKSEKKQYSEYMFNFIKGENNLIDNNTNNTTDSVHSPKNFENNNKNILIDKDNEKEDELIEEKNDNKIDLHSENKRYRHQINLSMVNKMYENHINNLNLEKKFFFGLDTNSFFSEKRNLILMELDVKNVNVHKLNITSKNFVNNFEYNEIFPYQFSKILNIENNSYITGGKSLNANNDKGNNFCYKINVKSEINTKFDISQIEIQKISSSLYPHCHHSVVYLKKYETIILCSGLNQINCEFFSLKSKKWDKLPPIKKPRINALSFVYNEKHIFLVGGKDENNEKFSEYFVFNFGKFIEKNFQSIWKSYVLKENKYLFEQVGSGIISNNNNIFIFGGYNCLKHFFIWKLNFEESDEIENYYLENNQSYKIKSVELNEKLVKYYNNQEKLNKNFGCSFCGDQNFIEYNTFYANVAFGGRVVIINKKLLDNYNK